MIIAIAMLLLLLILALLQKLQCPLSSESWIISSLEAIRYGSQRFTWTESINQLHKYICIYYEDSSLRYLLLLISAMSKHVIFSAHCYPDVQSHPGMLVRAYIQTCNGHTDTCFIICIHSFIQTSMDKCIHTYRILFVSVYIGIEHLTIESILLRNTLQTISIVRASLHTTHLWTCA